MAYSITFYSPRVEAETLALPPGMLANLLRTLELIEEFGPELGRPHTAPLGRGLFEIRAKGKEGVARSLFCCLEGREVVILLTAIKKANKLPARQVLVARRRMKEVQNHG